MPQLLNAGPESRFSLTYLFKVDMVTICICLGVLVRVSDSGKVHIWTDTCAVGECVCVSSRSTNTRRLPSSNGQRPLTFTKKGLSYC